MLATSDLPFRVYTQEEGIFPHQRSLANGEPYDAGDRDGESPAMAEERRLAYVGFTRARDRLYLTYCACRRSIGARRKLGADEGGPSRFLLAIPSELRQPVNMFGRFVSAVHPATDAGQNENGWALRAMVVLTSAGVDYAAREALEENGIESISWNQLELVAVGGSCRPTAAATAAWEAAAQLASACGRPTRGKRLQLRAPYLATDSQMKAVDSLVQGLESGLRFQASCRCSHLSVGSMRVFDGVSDNLVPAAVVAVSLADHNLAVKHVSATPRVTTNLPACLCILVVSFPHQIATDPAGGNGHWQDVCHGQRDSSVRAASPGACSKQDACSAIMQVCRNTVRSEC